MLVVPSTSGSSWVSGILDKTLNLSGKITRVDDNGNEADYIPIRGYNYHDGDAYPADYAIETW